MIAAAARVRSLLCFLAVALSLTACGDLLQEPDTGFLPAALRLEVVSGNGQTAAPGAALARPVRVRVFDAADRPAGGLWVEWSVPAGSGRAVTRNTFTDADGIAETTWILGPSAGPQTIKAFARGGGAITLHATAVTP